MEGPFKRGALRRWHADLERERHAAGRWHVLGVHWERGALPLGVHDLGEAERAAEGVGVVPWVEDEDGAADLLDGLLEPFVRLPPPRLRVPRREVEDPKEGRGDAVVRGALIGGVLAQIGLERIEEGRHRRPSRARDEDRRGAGVGWLGARHPLAQRRALRVARLL